MRSLTIRATNRINVQTGGSTNMFYSFKARSRGISILEILIGLGVLVLITSFAVPSFNNMAAKAELRVVLENTEFMVRAGRNTARMLETDVTMHLNSERHLEQHSITFSLPQKSATSAISTSIQDYQLPPGVRILADETEVHFDSRGLVETPVQLLLVSSADEDVTERLLIQ